MVNNRMNGPWNRVSLRFEFQSWEYKVKLDKAELLHKGIFFLIHLFARDVFVMKKLKIKSPLLLHQF